MKLRAFFVVAACALTVSTMATSITMVGAYYKVAHSNPDFQNGIDATIVTGLVNPQLGPNGFPVASAFGKSYNGPSGPLSNLNANDELLWWSPNDAGVTFEKIQVDNGINFPNGFYPDGQGGNDNFFRVVHWRGSFTLGAQQTVNFTVAADDDAWLFLNEQLVVDNGGVKGGNPSTNGVVTAPGIYQLDLFFADRHTSGSGIVFNADVTVVPEPSAVAALLTGAAGLIALRKRYSGS